MSVVKLYNPQAHEDNTLVIHKRDSGCCGNETDICRSRAALTGVTQLRGVTIDGNAILFDAPIPVANVKEIRVALAKALKIAGYDPYYEDIFRGIVVDADYVAIIGDGVFNSIQINTNTSVNFVKTCDTAYLCVYTATDSGVTPVVIGAVSNTLDFSAVAATLKAEVITKFGAVIDSVTTSAGKITITTWAEVATVDGTAMTKLRCFKGFK